MSTQKEMLQQALVGLGYERLMEEGTSLVAALQRSSAVSGSKGPRERVLEADRIYSGAIFGCLSKHDFGLPNLMAVLAKAQIYTPNSRNRSAPGLLMVPPGCLDLTKLTQASHMNYSISGLRATETGKVELPLSNVYTEQSTGIRVVTHYPVVDNSLGAANPQVKQNQLQRTVQIAQYYEMEEDKDDTTKMVAYITDFDKRKIEKIQVAKSTDGSERFVMRPSMALAMDSAIIVNSPGEQTGSLLYAYPSTGVSTSQTQEMMRVQLRVYLGAMLAQPENVTILNDIKFSGIIGGAGTKRKDNVGEYTPWGSDGSGDDIVILEKNKETEWADLFKMKAEGPDDAEAVDEVFYKSSKDIFKAEWAEAKRIFLGQEESAGSTPQHHFPILPYRGATFTKDGKCKTSNNGHLGWLDHPDHTAILEGMQVYCAKPVDVVMQEKC